MRVLMSRVGSATLKEPWDSRQDRLGSRPAMRTGPQLLLLDKLHPESLRFMLSSRLCCLYQRARQSWVSLSRDGSLPAPPSPRTESPFNPVAFSVEKEGGRKIWVSLGQAQGWVWYPGQRSTPPPLH